MSARLSFFDAVWAAARMPLALPVHEPVFRVQPWLTTSQTRADFGTDIVPVKARGDSAIMLMPARAGWFDDDVPAVCQAWPQVVVMTTPEWRWDADREDSGFEDYDYESTFFFGDRAAFRRAYRAARMIAAGRPIYDVIAHDCLFLGRPHPAAPKFFSVIAPAHRRLASRELSLAHVSRLGDMLFGHGCAYARTACRVCGCTDKDACPDGCWWEEPDLCSSCRERETDGPGEGFTGECDRCHRFKDRLELLPLTQFAECPVCQRGEPVNRQKGGR